MATYKQFYTDVLKLIGAPVTQGNLDALGGVAIFEGLNDRYNPMNSVVKSGDSTAFNKVGVQDYKTYANGVAGTVALLMGSRASGVRAALKTGDYNSVNDAIEKFYASWGSHFSPPSQQRASALLSQSLGAGSPVSGGETSTVTASPTDTNGAVINNAAFTAENTGVQTVGTQGASWWDDVNPLNWLAAVGGGVTDTKDAIMALANVTGFIAQWFKDLLWIFEPGHFIKMMLYIFGIGLIVFGIWTMVKGAGAEDAQVA